MSPITNVLAIVMDAGSTSDFHEASRAAGGAKEVDVRSDHTTAALQGIAYDCHAWAATEGVPGEPAAVRAELLFLLQRARTRALLRARQFRRVARVRVAITREGDHLLALLVEGDD